MYAENDSLSGARIEDESENKDENEEGIKGVAKHIPAGIRLSRSVHLPHVEDICEIARIGNRLAMVDKRNTITPVTKDSIAKLTQHITYGSKTSRIVAKGLSRAQVGKFTGSLKNADCAVSVRQLPNKKVRVGNRIGVIQNFEILIRKDAKNKEGG